MEGWKHQARRDGLRGEEESEKGKETDHWAWKAGRRGRRALPEAAQHMKLQGEEQIMLQHQSVSAQSVPHPLCRFCSLLLPARQQFCFHYGGEIGAITPPEPLPSPCQCCWQRQPRAWSPKTSANQKLPYLPSFRGVLLKIPPWMT